jgi:SAM-dependent methyltransferase
MSARASIECRVPDGTRLSVAGGVTGYRARTTALIRSVLASIAPIPDAVDVGAGDGWLARTLIDEGLIGRCTPVDVARREGVVVEPVLYDGQRLPFTDASVGLAYAVDAAHHAADPEQFIGELARISRRWVLLKDHTYRTPLGRLALKVLDEVGNCRFGVGSPGNYQRGFEWFAGLHSRGYALRLLIHPAKCHRGTLGLATNHLQFVALFENPDGA